MDIFHVKEDYYERTSATISTRKRTWQYWTREMKFVKKTFATWQELFEGFDTMYAITFSYNLDFIEKVMHQFKHAEVILGCEALVKFDLQTIMAHKRIH